MPSRAARHTVSLPASRSRSSAQHAPAATCVSCQTQSHALPSHVNRRDGRLCGCGDWQLHLCAEAEEDVGPVHHRLLRGKHITNQAWGGGVFRSLLPQVLGEPARLAVTLTRWLQDNGGPVYHNGTSGANNCTPSRPTLSSHLAIRCLTLWSQSVTEQAMPCDLSADPLKGGKTSQWEGGIRVNSWASGGFLPAKVRGTKYEGLATGWDWCKPPTFPSSVRSVRSTLAERSS